MATHATHGNQPQLVQGVINELPNFLKLLRDSGPDEAMRLPRAGQAERCAAYLSRCTQHERQEWLERLLDLPGTVRTNITNRLVAHREINRIIADSRVRLKRPLSADRHGVVHT